MNLFIKAVYFSTFFTFSIVSLAQVDDEFCQGLVKRHHKSVTQEDIHSPGLTRTGSAGRLRDETYWNPRALSPGHKYAVKRRASKNMNKQIITNDTNLVKEQTRELVDKFLSTIPKTINELSQEFTTSMRTGIETSLTRLFRNNPRRLATEISEHSYNLSEAERATFWERKANGTTDFNELTIELLKNGSAETTKDILENMGYKETNISSLELLNKKLSPYNLLYKKGEIIDSAFESFVSKLESGEISSSDPSSEALALAEKHAHALLTLLEETLEETFTLPSWIPFALDDDKKVRLKGIIIPILELALSRQDLRPTMHLLKEMGYRFGDSQYSFDRANRFLEAAGLSAISFSPSLRSNAIK